jgi:hypothetical protein
MTTLPPSPFITHRSRKERQMTANKILIVEGHDIEELGLIPHFIDQDDPRPAREQFTDNYGAWHPIAGFQKYTSEDGYAGLVYPGDEPLHPIAAFTLRDEMIVIYNHALVAIYDRQGNFEVARLD